MCGEWCVRQAEGRTLFAYALVPLWLGGGVTLVETDRRRRRLMAAMVAAGAVALPWLLATALAGSLHTRAAAAHVQYLTGAWLRFGGILGMAWWLAAWAIGMPGLP